MDFAKAEARRQVVQRELDDAKTPRERNELGQFATPTRLALDILHHGISLLSGRERIRFLDPAFGTGSFFSALHVTVPRGRITAAEGFEIDLHYGKPTLKLWKGSGLKLHLGDFTKAMPPKSEDKRFNLLICNPPYVRHHHVATANKVRLQHATEVACGVHIAGLAGLYCYFLGLSHAWMRTGGVAGWLIPSEFMDVNYGQPVKRYLLEQVTLLQIHRFDPQDVQFSDALVSSAVVWFKKQRPTPSHAVKFTFGGTLDAPKVSRTVPIADLRDEPKWTRFPMADVRMKPEGPTIGDFFSIKRGLATGDNSFFIMTRDQIAERGLPFKFFTPILPSPRHLGRDEIDADPEGVPRLDRKLFLLNCSLPEREVRDRYPKLWVYLQSGKPDVSTRYLCKTRSPWYAQENRPATPFLCTYMGRSDTKDGRPFRFLLNHSQATAANVYLLLYPKPVLTQALAEDADLARQIWLVLNQIGPAAMLSEGRVYGGGLHKLEPKELANVPAQAIAALLPHTRTKMQLELFTRQVA